MFLDLPVKLIPANGIHVPDSNRAELVKEIGVFVSAICAKAVRQIKSKRLA